MEHNALGKMLAKTEETAKRKLNEKIAPPSDKTLKEYLIECWMEGYLAGKEGDDSMNLATIECIEKKVMRMFADV